MRKIHLLFCAAILLLATFGLARSEEPRNGKARFPQKLLGTGPFSTLVNINNLSMWIVHDGSSARNPSTGNSGVSFPRGTATCIFADGLIWGGQVHDGGAQLLRVNGQTYQTGMVGGKIVSKGVPEPAGDQSVRIYRVRRDWESADLRQDAAELLGVALKDVSDGDIANVRAQYERDWEEWPVQKGAPFYDRDSNGIYTPARSLGTGKVTYDPAKDEPGIADGDQVVWFVMNDLNSAQSQSFLGSDPIGLEVQVTLWGYARSDQLGNVIFKKFKFIYKGTAAALPSAHVDSMFIGQWADPDLGDYSDDYEGCDTTLSLGYVYNSTTLDRDYHAFNLAPPAIGYDFFAGPIVAAPGDSAVFDLKRRYGFRNLPMTSWIYFAAGGTYSDPPFSYVGAGQWYNLLRGLTPITGAPFVYPGGAQTKFWLSGDPKSGSGYVDGVIDAPGDRRMLLASGPFTMTLGDTQDVVVAMVAGIGSDRLSSIAVQKYNDLSAQFAYDNLFDLPKAPPSPKVRIEQFHNQLVINWGYDLDAVKATESNINKGYAFEGYNVYQVPAATATLQEAKKIGAISIFDLVTDPTTILDNTFDQASGQILLTPVQLGRNSGITRYLVVKDDKLRAKPLVDGQSYYFAVTAYNNNSSPLVPSHSLENPLLVVRGIPQPPAPGTRLGTSLQQTIDLSPPTVHVQGISEIIPKVSVIDPAGITGHTYALSFAVDTSDALFKWNVRDQTLDSLLYKSSNFGAIVSGNLEDDYSFPIIGGLLYEVKEQTPALKKDSTRWISPNPVWIEGIRFTDPGDHAAAFDGGVTTGVQLGGFYLGHNASSFNPFFSYPAEVHFGTPQKAYRLRRTGPTGGYMIQATNPFVDVPFSVYDMSNPSSPRQLTVAWRDQNNNALWDPAVDDDGLEIVFISNKTYNATGTGQFALPPAAIEDECTSGPNADIVYGLSLGVVPGHVLNESAGTLRIVPFLHLTPNDKFVFTPAAPTRSADVARADVQKLNVFPNPYYGFNRAETNRFQRFVTFSHLPPGDWRIRIISLSGTLVKYIDPSSPGQTQLNQFATWDLNNQNGLPVASGIYIAYVEMPSIAVTKTLKVVIIQEQQVLDFY